MGRDPWRKRLPMGAQNVSNHGLAWCFVGRACQLLQDFDFFPITVGGANLDRKVSGTLLVWASEVIE